MPTHAIIITNQPELVAVYKKTVELTNAQIKALPTTAIQVDAALGAGKIHQIIGANYVLNSAGGAYTNVDDLSLIQVQYGDVDVKIFEATTPQFEAADVHFIPMIQSDSNFTTADANQVLKVKSTNSLGDYTGGHDDNTLKITVCYLIVDL